ncbi:MAG: hypothetical protein M1838_000787 [Thelocarpon superellum]|nr:MAG: hypothetical protein M1838_000787 [Thelocarpon superellum]
MSRQNAYFLPGEGIAREVITADICRYLGNNALVKPAVHEGVHGFTITAYRALTADMIADLKSDSANWRSERNLALSSRNGAVPYSDSKTHQRRQYFGPTEAQTPQQEPANPAQYPGHGTLPPSDQNVPYGPHSGAGGYNPQESPAGYPPNWQYPNTTADFQDEQYSHHINLEPEENRNVPRNAVNEAAYPNQQAGPDRQGYPPQGYPPQGYPPQGYPPQGYPPQGYSSRQSNPPHLPHGQQYPPPREPYGSQREPYGGRGDHYRR